METFKTNKSKILISLIALLLFIITIFAFAGCSDSKEITQDEFYTRLEFAGCSDSKEITQDEFYTRLEAGEVAGVHFYNTTVYIVCVGETDVETTKKLANFPKEYDFYIQVAYTFQVENIQKAVEQYNLDNQANIVISSEPVRDDEQEENQ